MINFTLDSEYIHLIQLLKAVNVVENGGEAQAVVSEGLVSCNGVTEFRKRYKVRKGDVIEFLQYKIVVD
ncbi:MULTISPECIES: RNA-binding S4 domain-containing protein [Olivibacter]|jgi:ribosome-associated protein|uniref:RNA-binding S4 domain protein n=2 Tax=Sphingobacteriaceae TaxID=84566 RepID=F4CCZ9_SPHS2|nr:MULTISPECIES: RNA-binding S4 domain-containing protein [Olivibacter]MDM8176566.1 RNA-binding S4 domain-containing protein [Olivibacter sp. 47]QEL00827.1 RNA-binding S4 domain-containing protein [Olivibacter sp. LS-1]